MGPPRLRARGRDVVAGFDLGNAGAAADVEQVLQAHGRDGADLVLSGIPLSTIQKVLKEKITPSSGAKELVATMRAAGAYTALVSGGFGFFTSKVRRMLGFDFDQGRLSPKPNSAGIAARAFQLRDDVA